METSSLALLAWCIGYDAELSWQLGTGDAKTSGWTREDGARAIDTNGDPVFEGQEGFEEAWAIGAGEGVWNAYAWTHPEEPNNFEQVLVGAAPTKAAALRLLPRNARGERVGQLQFGFDGEVVNP